VPAAVPAGHAHADGVEELAVAVSEQAS